MTRELARRIAFTLGALFVYRLGLHIPLPGIDLRVWDEIFRNQAPGIMGMIGFLPTSHMAIFALGIVPYITAAVLVQLATIVSRRVRALAQQGERGRQTLVRYTRHLTLLLTASQAWAVAGGLEQVADVVTRPGPLFMVSTVITLTGGTMLLVWLAEQITLRGLGNGIALILLASTVTQLPEAIAFTVELGRQRVLSTKLSAALLLLVVAVTAFIVWMELARRRLPIRFPGRQASVGTPDHQPSHLSLKLNPAGVIPVLLASWLIGILLALGTFVAGHDAELWIAIMGQLGHGRLLHLILYAAFILVCTFFYTAFLVDPDGTAEKLKTLGGAIPTIDPGEATAAHLDHVVSRTTVIGAAYLVLVCLLPEILIRYAGVPFYFGGTSLLVVVCTTLDLDAQLRAELQSG